MTKVTPLKTKGNEGLSPLTPVRRKAILKTELKSPLKRTATKLKKQTSSVSNKSVKSESE